LLVVAVAAGGPVAVLATALLVFYPRSRAPASSPASDAPPAPAAAPDAASVPSPDGPARAATVDLEIAATPPGAEVFLDGTRLGVDPGPFAVAPSATPRRLELRKAGYVPWTSDLVIVRSVVVPVRLERRRPAAAAPAHRSPEDID